jgi:DDE superfamily endonuclease
MGPLIGTQMGPHSVFGLTACRHSRSCSKCRIAAAGTQLTSPSASQRRRARDSPGRTIQAILDNYAAHKHPALRKWLARHPRWTFHFTATSASWLNAVDGFFAVLSKRPLKRDIVRPVADLQAAINRFLDHHTAHSKTFPWIADPDKIVAAVRRGHQALDSIH